MAGRKVSAAPGEQRSLRDKKVIKGLDAFEAILSTKQSPIDVREIAYQFMRQVGGPEGFVAAIFEEYDQSAAGSLARSRILDIMIRLFQMATPKEKFGELGHLSDEDLERLLKEQLGGVRSGDIGAGQVGIHGAGAASAPAAAAEDFGVGGAGI